MNLNELTQTGHFTKVFDASRRIPDDVFDILLKFIYSIPASVNAQSSHYVVATDMQSRSRIANAIGDGFGINVPKIMNSSHVMVFATHETLSNDYLDELHAKEIADGKFPDEKIANQWKSIVRGWIDLHRYDGKDLQHWMEKQTYMALGMTLMAAAELGIDVTPLEGFSSRTLDAELGLREKGGDRTARVGISGRLRFSCEDAKVASADGTALHLPLEVEFARKFAGLPIGDSR